MERLTEKQLHILQTKLCDMKRRCYNTKDKFYKDYGGRGIKICEEWMDKKNGHKNFQKWAVETGWEEGYSIDRIDVNGNYEPSNCRWANPSQQANNRRNNFYVTINGVTKTSTEWAKQIGISQRAFIERIKNGWEENKLLEPKYKPLKMSKAEMAKEIREWRNVEEQGFLLRLPCKVGDTVYQISENFIEPCTVETIFLGNYMDRNGNCCNMAEIYYDRYDCPYVSTEIYFTDIGETVFLTREEAEAKLKEMEGAE